MTQIPPTDDQITRAWQRHGLALAALLILTVIAFQSSLAAAVRVWWISPTYSHCFLIIPIAAWLIWEKRPALRKLAPGLAPLVLLLIPPLAFGWWIGELSAINEVQQYAVVGIAQALIVALLGFNVIRVIWFPVLYLLFLVPTGEYLIVPMQNFATHFVDVCLTLMGIVHHTEGTTFELSNGFFEIAEACAGLRFLIATVTLGVLFSFLMFRKPYKIIVFLLSCVAVPLIGNGMRCVGIIVLAHLTNNEYGAGADHIVYGWGFNVAILLVLGVIGFRMRDEFSEKENLRFGPATSSQRLTLVALTASALVIAGPALAWWHNNHFAEPDLAEIDRLVHPEGWQSVPASTSWRPDFSGFDAQTTAAVVPADASDLIPVDLFVGYYARPRPGHSMTAHANRFWDNEEWVLTSAGNFTAKLAGQPAEFQEWIISSSYEKRIVWSTYWVNRRFTTSMFKVKLLQAQAALQGHDGQAVIAYATQIDGTIEEARARLARSLPTLDSLPARLTQINPPAQGQDVSASGGTR